MVLLLSHRVGASVVLVLCMCAAMTCAERPNPPLRASSSCAPGRMKRDWATTRDPPKSVYTAIKEGLKAKGTKQELKAKGIKLCAKPVVQLRSACARRNSVGTTWFAEVDYQTFARVACPGHGAFRVLSTVRFSIRAGQQTSKVVGNQTVIPPTPKPALVGGSKGCACPAVSDGYQNYPTTCTGNNMCTPICPAGQGPTYTVSVGDIENTFGAACCPLGPVTGGPFYTFQCLEYYYNRCTYNFFTCTYNS